MATVASNNFVANVYSYVATQTRMSDLGNVADSTADIEAIFGLYEAQNEKVKHLFFSLTLISVFQRPVSFSLQETKFVLNMQRMFYQFVRDGSMPQEKDLTLGMYMVDDSITTQKEYANCKFWDANGISEQTYAYHY